VVCGNDSEIFKLPNRLLDSCNEGIQLAKDLADKGRVSFPICASLLQGFGFCWESYYLGNPHQERLDKVVA
jgi:hypothetical protein